MAKDKAPEPVKDKGMRDLFPGYYKPTEPEFSELWKDALIVPDTNALLNLYRYSEETRQDWLGQLTSLKERLWIPHRVAFEFQDRRMTVITGEKNRYDTVSKGIAAAEAQLQQLFNGTWRFAPKEIDEWREKTSAVFSEMNKRVAKFKGKHPDHITRDPVREELDQLLSGRIGEDFEEAPKKEILATGQKRYDGRIPPGYKDASKKDDESRYGDLLIWFQLIEKTKISGKPIIFVTDDRKEDWWQVVEGKTIGPRPELIQEFRRKTGGRNFYMYTPSDFIKIAAKHSIKAVEPLTAKEMEAVSAEIDWTKRSMLDLLNVPVVDSGVLGASLAASSAGISGSLSEWLKADPSIVGPNPYLTLTPSSAILNFAGSSIPPGLTLSMADISKITLDHARSNYGVRMLEENAGNTALKLPPDDGKEKKGKQETEK
jgi:hypothetical protein